MKTCISIFVIAMSVVVWGCNSRHEKTAEEIAAAETAKADSLKNVAASQLAARRAELRELRERKAERRRIAIEEKAKVSPTYKHPSGKLVYYKGEVDPSYPGGNEAMHKYLTDNLTYPEAAQSKGVEGTVFVDFVVDRKGKVTDVQATETTWDEVDSTLVNEAVRVVSSMPAWVAGTQGGKPVDIAYSLPVIFELER